MGKRVLILYIYPKDSTLPQILTHPCLLQLYSKKSGLERDIKNGTQPWTPNTVILTCQVRCAWCDSSMTIRGVGSEVHLMERLHAWCFNSGQKLVVPGMVVLALGRQSQADLCDFKTRLVYIAISKPARAMWWDPIFKIKSAGLQCLGGMLSR